VVKFYKRIKVIYIFLLSSIDLSQGCRTCSTNTIFVPNNIIVIAVLYRRLVLQCYSKIIITRNHLHYYLHPFMIADNFWLSKFFYRVGVR
jgi:hypothetical protein